MTIQDQYHQSRTHPETVEPNPGPLFFFSGVDIAECVKASLVTREYFGYNPIMPKKYQKKRIRKVNYTPFMNREFTIDEQEIIKEMQTLQYNTEQIAKALNRTEWHINRIILYNRN